MAAGSSASPYQVRPSGDPLTDGWRLFYSDASGKPISPFHDIPLKTAEGHYHFVCEIPRGLNAKLEINKNEPLNPIKQDIKRGALRFVHDVHPYRGYIWNYGAFPQTWEDPTHKDESTGCYGDNDPLDVCEIGSETASIGQIKVVKILGVIALIDEGETDWKVISIDVNDPLAEKLNDISDVETHLPGFTMATYEWFRTYKIPAGSPANSFALEGAAMNKEFAIKVIEENHLFWKNLHSGATPASGTKSGNGEKYEVSLTNTTLGNAHTPAEAPVLPNLGDHGLPVSKHTGSSSAPDGSVLTEVESLQQRRPHATASLSAVLADVADAIASGDLAKLTGSQNVKSLHVPGSPTKAVSEGNKIWPYSVAISTDQLASGPISFGVYQQTSPHGLPHAKPLPKGDHADFAELVAAGYVSKSGHLVIHSGAGKLVFANSNGRFVAVDASTADLSHSVESSCALAAQAPLGLIAAL